MGKFYTKIVGTTFENRQELIGDLVFNEKLKPGTELELVPDPYNIYDENHTAVKVVMQDGRQLGFISKEYNGRFFYDLRAGKKFTVRVTEVTGGEYGKENYGINIEIESRY